MKRLRDFFKSKPELLKEDSVLDLIDYCQDLEGEIIEKKSKEKFNNESVLLEFLNELQRSCKDLEIQEIESERFGLPRVDFREAVKNLSTYIEKFKEDNFI
jgi:hypothetical protein